MAHEIFISYSHKDKATADAICAYVESKGLRCWYAPRDIMPGASWANSIIEAIDSTKILVLVFTEHSNISPQVLREVSNAVSAGVTVVPLKLTEKEPISGMKYYLATVHWLDAMNEDLSAAIENLYVLCKSILEAKASTEITEELKERSARALAEKQEAEKAAQLKKKKRLIATISSVAAAIIVVAAVLLFALPKSDSSPVPEEKGAAREKIVLEAVSADPTETYTRGNSQGNLQSGGFLVCDGEWYYYRSSDKQSMYKMRLDGSEKTKMTYEPASCISVYNGYIYYYTSSTDPAIKRMKTDGTDMKILHLGNVEGVRIVNDRVYYKDGRNSLNLYSMTLDGKDVRLENSLEKTYSWCTDGKYIYYANQNDEGFLYRADMNGENLTCLLDHKIEGMTIAGNLLYFNDLKTNYFSTYDLSSGEIKKLCSDYIYYINITKDGIYGYSGTYDTKLCYVQLDGLGQTLLTEGGVKSVCVSGEKIFFLDKESDEYFISDLKGENVIVP